MTARGVKGFWSEQQQGELMNFEQDDSNGWLQGPTKATMTLTGSRHAEGNLPSMGARHNDCSLSSMGDRHGDSSTV